MVLSNSYTIDLSPPAPSFLLKERGGKLLEEACLFQDITIFLGGKEGAIILIV